MLSLKNRNMTACWCDFLWCLFFIFLLVLHCWLFRVFLLFPHNHLLRITIGFPSSWVVCVLHVSGFSSSESPTYIISRRLFIHFIFLWRFNVHFLRFLVIHSFSFIASSSSSLISSSSSSSSIVAAGIIKIKTKVLFVLLY